MHSLSGLQVNKLQNQLDPHFLSNALNSLGTLFANNETQKQKNS
ncbi:MAG: histidine kinase [Bacteroidales bacterium]|nr:histidine kinase [Bacteroidales bacterium]